jgi:methylisocitrate lyase
MMTTTMGRILGEPGTIAFPGVFDALSARIAERTGFPMAFISGNSVAATTIGEPDRGLLTFPEFNELISVEEKDALARRFGAP